MDLATVKEPPPAKSRLTALGDPVATAAAAALDMASASGAMQGYAYVRDGLVQPARELTRLDFVVRLHCLQEFCA